MATKVKHTKKKGLPPAALAAIETAKEMHKAEKPLEVTLIHGVTATLHAVAPSLIQDVQLRIEDPKVPVVYIEAKERDEENPNDPSYLAAMDRAAQERNAAVMDALIMMGVELPEGFEVPPKWVKRLKILGFDFDEDDPDEVEFVFKKYHTSTSVIATLSVMSGIREEDVAAFRELFRG